MTKFHSYKMKEKVRIKSVEENVKHKLKAENKGVGIQTPYPTRMARKALLPIAKEEERKGRHKGL